MFVCQFHCCEHEYLMNAVRKHLPICQNGLMDEIMSF